MSFKKVRLVPWKRPSEVIQKEVVEEIVRDVMEAEKSNWKIIILHQDPMHQIYNNENWYSRQEKGKWWTKWVNSNSWRERINIIWALNLVTKRPTTIITQANCDKETIKIFLQEIKKEYQWAEKIKIYLDNARYQRSYEVQELAKELWIELRFLPPYTPNLNLIERLRKFIKKKVFKHKYYESFELFEAAIITFFHDIDTRDNELQSLLTIKFEILPVV